MRVPSAIADYLILNVLRESNGGAIAVSDDDLLDHMRLIARTEGIVVGPEGRRNRRSRPPPHRSSGVLSPSDHILLLNTGSGLKAPELM